MADERDDKGTGANRRTTSRRGGLSVGWAIIMLDGGVEVPCWVVDESPTGVGLETRKQITPCPVEHGQTYWMRLKPSSAKHDRWTAATIKHIREKGVGSGIYKLGIHIASSPPPELGHAPGL